MNRCCIFCCLCLSGPYQPFSFNVVQVRFEEVRGPTNSVDLQEENEMVNTIIRTRFLIEICIDKIKTRIANPKIYKGKAMNLAETAKDNEELYHQACKQHRRKARYQ